MRRIAIGLQPQLKRVEAVLSNGLLFSESIAGEFRRLGHRFALFCDDRVDSLIGKKWCSHLEKAGLQIDLFSFPSGEQEKNRERKAALEDLLFSQKFGKDTCMIALGGGVTTDLIGYLASTFCRGVPLVLAPTTLLGMVDAAIGGKTGVNTRFGKNLLGTFYPADKILIDSSMLSSLSPSEWTSGSAEVIKYALIRSPQLFQLLRNWNSKDMAYLDRIIHECVLIKAQVVEIDFEEKTGLRRILNFGHTIAHALELLENYELSHGEAVAIGMLVESYISVKMGHLPAAEFAQIDAMIRSFAFALVLSKEVTLEKMRDALLSDKKAAKGAVRFVQLEKIGACMSFNGEYCASVPQEILEEAISWMLAKFSGGSK
ncbi:MAG: 3-dehydroquinate synthase [Verrucomicrobia bacterium]|nr:3-dehydroquinate synthase [Verrucomicrobiota bacterium]